MNKIIELVGKIILGIAGAILCFLAGWLLRAHKQRRINAMPKPEKVKDKVAV